MSMKASAFCSFQKIPLPFMRRLMTRRMVLSIAPLPRVIRLRLHIKYCRCSHSPWILKYHLVRCNPDFINHPIEAVPYPRGAIGDKFKALGILRAKSM